MLQPKKFIRLNLVSNAAQEDKEIKSDCLLLKLYGDVAAIKKKRRPMEMENIGRSEDQSVAQHILVEGSPGIGKTMFSWELCCQWAEGKMLQAWQIVLMLQLRRKYVREAKSLSDLFSYDDDSIKQEVLRHIVSLNGRGVFLVLEGYDELTEDQRTEGSILNRLLKGDCIPKATIMVTSRPLASDSLCPEFKKTIHQHIEVVGFNDENIKSYVESVCQNEQPQIVPSDLLSQIKSNPFVSSIMYIPLQCATLTALYIEKWRENKGKAYAPTTLTQLYTDLLLSSLIRYINDHPVYSRRKIRQLSDLPSEVQEQVWKLSQLAAEGLENRQFIFDSIPCDHMGLMQSAEEELVIGSSVSYCFLHLTLQEYLAALHWSRMGSEDMVRLVSETSLFPLDTLVRNGITAGHHWPALYFLSGLTKLTSVPLELLNKPLQAADSMVNSDYSDSINLMQQVLDIDLFSMNTAMNKKKCNPHFFQIMFETQSRDLTTKLFTNVNIYPAITTPLECFVTAWCVANSDPTSQWIPEFENILVLKYFLEHFERFAIDCGSTKSSYGSVVGMGLTSSQHLISQHVTAELVQSLSSLFPCLEIFVFGIDAPADIEQMVPLLGSVFKLVSSMKTLMIGSNDTDQEGELPAAVCIPPLHCPSLTTVYLVGRASASLIQSSVLPNINTLTSILLEKCRPMSGSDYGNFCTCLCQSTSLECLVWEDAYLNAHEMKELVSALEQISSLKMVNYNHTTILTDVGIRQYKQAMSSSAVIQGFNDGTYNKKQFEDVLRKMTRPLRSLLSDQDSSQQPALVTAADTLASSSHHSADSEDRQK